MEIEIPKGQAFMFRRHTQQTPSESVRLKLFNTDEQQR
jgi:hypothetical protein